jgi:hypothetical protein
MTKTLTLNLTTLKISEGIVLVGSDCHWRPDVAPSTAHRAFVTLATRFSEAGTLKAVVLNGDVFDFPAISTHARIGWEHQPRPVDEIAEVQARMAEIAAAAPSVPLLLTIGNHCKRLDDYLSRNAGQLEGLPGCRLRDHIAPRWLMDWQFELNPGPDGVLIRHRFKGGAGAGLANIRAAGKSVVTGHTHQGNVVRLSFGERHLFGVDSGTMATLSSPAFSAYTEKAAGCMSNWASGFAVLSFNRGRLLAPELVLVTDEATGCYSFRGQLQPLEQPRQQRRRNGSGKG